MIKIHFIQKSKGEFIDQIKGQENQNKFDCDIDISLLEWKRMMSLEPKYKLRPNWVFTKGKIKPLMSNKAN